MPIRSQSLLTGVLALGLLLTACAYPVRPSIDYAAPAEPLDEVVRTLEPVSHDEPTTLTVTRDGAILTALARNRSLAVQRFDPDIALTFPREARAAFDPTLLSTITYSFLREQRRGSVSTPTTDPVTERTTVDLTTRLVNRLPTGTELFLAGGMTRFDTSFTDREYRGSWSVGLTQSLLRGAGTAVNLVELRQARNDVAISEHQLRDFTIELVRQVEIAYWDLVLARSALDIQDNAVELARQQLSLNEVFLEVGKGTRSDVVSARAAVATREADLIDARTQLRQREIALVRLLDPGTSSQYRTHFVPVDEAEVAPIDVSPEVSGQLARLYRPDLAEAKLRFDNSQLEVVRTRNGLLPRLDLFASYGRTSLGESFSGGLEYLDQHEYYNYEIGANLEIQPLNRAARARDNRVRFLRAQSEAAIANLEHTIDASLHDLAAEIERQWERINATKLTVASREEELRAVRAQFEQGLATTLDVLVVQDNLVRARLDHTTARVRYIQALTNYYAAEATLLERRGVGLNTSGTE